VEKPLAETDTLVSHGVDQRSLGMSDLVDGCPVPAQQPGRGQVIEGVMDDDDPAGLSHRET
jgi:hypothetical protein